MILSMATIHKLTNIIDGTMGAKQVTPLVFIDIQGTFDRGYWNNFGKHEHFRSDCQIHNHIVKF